MTNNRDQKSSNQSSSFSYCEYYGQDNTRYDFTIKVK